MLNTPRSLRGMVTSSHHLAAQSGLDVLREGGNAIEAMVAAAATVSVVYAHMNSIGGDGFWLISTPGQRAPRAIAAVGAAGAATEEKLYRDLGLSEVPARGPLAANTVAGTVDGWRLALEISAEWGGKMKLERLMEDAAYYATNGVPVTVDQFDHTTAQRDALIDVPGWAEVFLADGAPPAPGTIFKQPALGETLARMAKHGLDDFYRGDLARAIGADLARAGSPVTADDLAGHRAKSVEPLTVSVKGANIYNVPPPSQGLASLIILGLFDRLKCAEAEGFEYVHKLVEATKQAILTRNEHVTDPAYMTRDPNEFLTEDALAKLAANISASKALPWPVEAAPGDTVWLGAVDGEGRAVSFIHSIYWEFGSGVVLRDTGVMCQNRGSSFSLDPKAQNYMRPGRLPFHTNNPALALFDDGRVMVYGAMGGEGQPQTQAALFSRYGLFGQELQAAVTAPRWVLSRTWGEVRTDLRLESRFSAAVIDQLRAAGHDVTTIGDFDPIMGHAGAIVRHQSGLLEGATDPRSDGVVAAF